MGKDHPQTKQPGRDWMPMPENIEGCPKGLEYLAMVDQLIVEQQVELLEAFTSFETNNRYEVKNVMGQKVMIAVEHNDCCTRMCCGARRTFDMEIMDNFAKKVLQIHRPLRCSTCWFPCCLQEADIKDAEGNLLGSIHQCWSVFAPEYNIHNAVGDTVLKIKGPCFTCNMCGDVKFEILTGDGDTQVGEIRKQWSGLVKEAFTDADNFGITFPTDMDVSLKAVLLGAVFLIDFMFFEKRGNKPNNKNVSMTAESVPMI